MLVLVIPQSTRRSSTASPKAQDDLEQRFIKGHLMRAGVFTRDLPKSLEVRVVAGSLGTFTAPDSLA